MRPGVIDSSNLSASARSRLGDVVAEVLGQVELANDRHRIHAWVAARAEDLGDHAFAIVHMAGKADHVEDYFVADLGILCAGVADGDWLGEHLAVHQYHAQAARLEIRADEGVGIAFEYFDDRAGRVAKPPAPILRHAHQHRVAAGRVGGVVGGDVDVLFAGVGYAVPAGRTKPKPAAARRKTPVMRFCAGTPLPAWTM